jgi:hypothetical protein
VKKKKKKKKKKGKFLFGKNIKKKNPQLPAIYDLTP